jgi:hypothetical protein
MKMMVVSIRLVKTVADNGFDQGDEDYDRLRLWSGG